MDKIITNKSIETFKVGFVLGQELQGGEVLALIGDLGAGKTKFLQGLAKGLGVKERVNSPTFNILKVYQISKNNLRKRGLKLFCHIDAYRLGSDKDLLTLGVEEFFQDSEAVTAIEWAEKVKKIWPKKTIIIKIKNLSSNKREITVKLPA